MALERLGNEKTRVERGAATKVRANEPKKRPGKFDNPNDMAPSSRNGRTTKYALNICPSKISKLKEISKNKNKRKIFALDWIESSIH